MAGKGDVAPKYAQTPPPPPRRRPTRSADRARGLKPCGQAYVRTCFVKPCPQRNGLCLDEARGPHLLFPLVTQASLASLT